MMTPEFVQKLCERFASRTEIPGASIELLTDEAAQGDEVRQAGQLVAQAFLEREPMAKALNEQDPTGQVASDMHDVALGMAQEAAKHGLSFVLKTQSGQVIGTVLCEPFTGMEMELPPSLAPVAQVLNRLTRTFNQEWDKRSKPQAFQIVMFATHRDYQGGSISVPLLSIAAKTAQARGIVEAVTEATSNSQILFGRLGFKTLGEVSYAEIPQFAAIPEQKPANPRHHRVTHAKLMWAPIDELLVAE